MTTDKETTHTSTAMADPTELLTNALRDCASALAYAAFNIDGKTLDDLDPRLSDSTDVSASCLIAERSARAALAEAKRAALARRAAQPVAPVQPQSELEKALRELMSIVRIHSEDIGENFAWAEMQYAKEVLATPSPQVADIAEDTDRLLRAGRNLHELAKRMGWPDDGEGAYEYVQRLSYELGQSDAIAASRRAAGGEAEGLYAKIKALTCAAHPAGYTTKEARMFNIGFYAGTTLSAETVKTSIIPAPASAGQAEASRAGRQYQRKVDEKIITRRDAEIASLRAGQAGQVADQLDSLLTIFEQGGITKATVTAQIYRIMGATESAAAPADRQQPSPWFDSAMDTGIIPSCAQPQPEAKGSK